MKKISIMLLLFFSMVLVGCRKKDTYIVSFNSKLGTIIKDVEVLKNNKINKPDDPKRDYYDFLYWEYLGEEFDFSKEITKNITLVAKWKSNLNELPYYNYLNENNPTIIISVKNYGIMELELFRDVAPITVSTFLEIIKDKSFNNSTFHRIIKSFMIQGGIVKKNYLPITGEFSSNGVENDLKHFRGVISMARTNDPNSATSQFFIVDKTSPHLDGNYAAFGGLVSGFDVLDKIASVNTDWYDMPLEEVVIEYIKLKK